MTISEFIEKLKNYPSNAEVLAAWEGGYSSLHRITMENSRVIIDVDHYCGDPAVAATEDKEIDEDVL